MQSTAMGACLPGNNSSELNDKECTFSILSTGRVIEDGTKRANCCGQDGACGGYA